MAEHVLAICPAAEASWYDDAAHAPHLEDPGRFNRELAPAPGDGVVAGHGGLPGHPDVTRLR
jgi:hypothetical protein